jgi:hypothetical protein
LSSAGGRVGASICIERKLCLTPAEANNVDTLGADYLLEGVVMVIWSLPWSFGGSASKHRSRSLVAGPFGGALGLSVGRCALVVRS